MTLTSDTKIRQFEKKKPRASPDSLPLSSLVLLCFVLYFRTLAQPYGGSRQHTGSSIISHLRQT